MTYEEWRDGLQGDNNSGIIKAVKIPQEYQYISSIKNNLIDKDIDIEIIKTLNDTILSAQKRGELFDFSEIKTGKLKGVYEKAFMVTDSQYIGGSVENILVINETYFSDRKLSEINEYTQKLYKKGWWKSKNFEDLINHEILHAKIATKNSYEKSIALYQFVSEENGIEDFCRMVAMDKSEFLNEVYILICRSEVVEDKYLKVFEKYENNYL